MGGVKIKVLLGTVLEFPIPTARPAIRSTRSPRGRAEWSWKEHGVPMRSSSGGKVVSLVTLSTCFRGSTHQPVYSGAFRGCAAFSWGPRGQAPQPRLAACFCVAVKVLNYRFPCPALGGSEGRGWVALRVSGSLLGLLNQFPSVSLPRLCPHEMASVCGRCQWLPPARG